MIDRAAVALAFASAAFVSVPASLIPQPARAEDERRRVDAGRRIPTSPRQPGCRIPAPGFSGCLTASGYARWQTIDIGNGVGMATVIKKGDPARRARRYGHFATGGIDDRIESTLPPVFSPKMVPRS